MRRTLTEADISDLDDVAATFVQLKKDVAGIDIVAINERLVQGFQDHHAHAFTADITVGGFVKGFNRFGDPYDRPATGRAPSDLKLPPLPIE